MTKVSELIDKLTGLGNFGLQSAGTLAGAGSRSSTTSKSSGGIFNSLFPGGLSDRRTKRNIVKIAEFDDGLGLYDFEYVFAPGLVFRGVMADEVQTLRPEAMGPMVGEYLTVDYSKIGGLTDGPILIKEVA